MQDRASNINLQRLDTRVESVKSRIDSKPYNKKKSALECELQGFLKALPSQDDVQTCSPEDVLRFLAWKDEAGKGKTQVHLVDCKFLGQPGIYDCGCPVRLSAGYIKGIVVKLKSIFAERGRGTAWDGTGNPACAPGVTAYYKGVEDEQAEAHVVPVQATPLLPEKLVKLSNYLTRELIYGDLGPKEEFLVARDRAFFMLQFFAGDRGHDLCHLLGQEIRRLPGDVGLLVRQTYGKQRNINVFAIKRSSDPAMCPVKALDEYITRGRQLGVDMAVGYVFRAVSAEGNVLDSCLSQSAISKRLARHLSSIGLFQGETTHGIRGGCAVTLGLLGASSQEAKDHIGWKSNSSWELYSRHKARKALNVADMLSNVVANAQESLSLSEQYCFIDLQGLELAYPSSDR